MGKQGHPWAPTAAMCVLLCKEVSAIRFSPFPLDARNPAFDRTRRGDRRARKFSPKTMGPCRCLYSDGNRLPPDAGRTTTPIFQSLSQKFPSHNIPPHRMPEGVTSTPASKNNVRRRHGLAWAQRPRAKSKNTRRIGNQPAPAQGKIPSAPPFMTGRPAQDGERSTAIAIAERIFQ